jgi:hypothetical protein
MGMSNLNNSLNSQPALNAPNLAIYSPKISERLNHALGFIFNKVFKLNFQIFTIEAEFEKHLGPKINYSNTDLKNCIHITPHHFIFDKGVSEDLFSISVIGSRLQLHIESAKTNVASTLDVFSSVFYFISRYEEWQAFEPDSHGRFEAQSSILYRNNFHLKPLVDIWLEELRTELQAFYPQIVFPKPSFNIISTLDIDNVYAYKSKGMIRTLGAFARDFLTFKFITLIQRTKVVVFKGKDPFDVYEDLSQFCKEHQIPLICFFLFRSGTKFDRTLNPKSNVFYNIFNLLNTNKAHIALHPSYDSVTNEELFLEEKAMFDEKANQHTIFSRQHFLRFNIKTTPQLLIKSGIKADFTMGFASEIGFRAGTSHPFFYYDFSKEQATNLLMVPFCAMDGAYTVYKNKSANDMQIQWLNLAREIKNVGGYFISIYHERTFYDHLYKDFGDLYKKIHLAIK